MKDYKFLFSVCPFCGSKMSGSSADESCQESSNQQCSQLSNKENSHYFQVRFNSEGVQEVRVAFAFNRSEIYGIHFNLIDENSKIYQYTRVDYKPLLDCNWSNVLMYDVNKIVKFNNLDALKDKIETYVTMC